MLLTSGFVSAKKDLDTMTDYTSYSSEDELDWLASAIECADNTPAPIKPPLTANELLLLKLRKRLYAHTYRSKYPDRIKARRKLKSNGNPDNSATANDVALQLKTQNNKCWWCGKKLKNDYQVDHRVPLDKGGSITAGNIVISCKKCNLSKGSKMPHEWNGRLL